MTAAPYILARTLKEAHAFAQERGFTRGRYRIVNSPGTLKSVRNADLFLVPGWEKRYDRFAMKGAIRYTRMNIIDVATLEEPAAPKICKWANQICEYPNNHGCSGESQSTPEEEQVTSDFFSLFAAPPVEPTPEPDPVLDAVPDTLEPAGEQLAIPVEPAAEEPKPEEKPKNRRRSRCKQCGNLHYKDEPCPSNESV